MIRFVVIAAMMISIKYIYNGYLINKNKEVLWYYDSNSNYHLSLDEKDSINLSFEGIKCRSRLAAVVK